MIKGFRYADAAGFVFSPHLRCYTKPMTGFHLGVVSYLASISAVIRNPRLETFDRIPLIGFPTLKLRLVFTRGPVLSLPASWKFSRRLIKQKQVYEVLLVDKEGYITEEIGRAHV